MIFSADLAHLIVAGKKTQTRRTVKAAERECRFRPGRSYAVEPGRRRAGVARILITDITQEDVADITFAAARAEGFKTTLEFKHHWLSLHDAAWLDRLDDTWADPTDAGYDELVLERFDARHADTLVWVITFQLDRQHLPRYLHRHSERGYTSREHDALHHEPEAIDAITQERYARQARERDVARRRGEDRRALLEQRLDAACALALLRGVDVKDDTRIARRRLEALDRNPGDDVAAVALERRIVAIERKATRQEAA